MFSDSNLKMMHISAQYANTLAINEFCNLDLLKHRTELIFQSCPMLHFIGTPYSMTSRMRKNIFINRRKKHGIIIFRERKKNKE